MPADLDKTRALLASLAGFTPGPWHRDGFDVVPARLSSEGWRIADCGTSDSPDSAPYNADLIAAAPNLHRHASELADEVERLRAEVEALRAGQDEAVAAERHRIGAWIRAQKEVNVVDRLSLSRAIEHGDHIDDDAPPLPSLRSLMLLRDELLRQVAALTAEVKP